MRDFWRRPLVIGLLLVSVTLLCVSGSASAKVTDVQIQSPTEALPYPSLTGYVKPGTDVTVTALVTVDATADVWMNATIGGSTIAASKVGSITVPGPDPVSAAFSVTITLGSGESDGPKNVMVQAYAQADGITLSDTEAKAVRVDATAPSIGPWSPADASFANITTQTFVVPVSDAASGVNWSGIGIASVDVSGGVLDSVSYNIGAGTVTIAVKDMNAPGAKSVTLRVSDVAGNQATDTHGFTIVDSAKPTMGAWDINGTGVTNGVWIPTDSATFGEQITDSLPSLGITSVTARLDGGSATPVPYDTGSRYAISYSGMSDGAHTLEFTATDGSGNSQSATLSFNVDTVDPVIDGDSWSPASGSWITSSSATITVNASDSGSGIKGATAGASILPVGPTVTPSYAGGKIMIHVSGLAEGEYTLSTWIEDNVGHTAATKSMTFKVDLGGPVFANAFPSNGLETNNTGIAPNIEITDPVSGVNSGSIIWTMTAPGGGSVGGAHLWSAPTSTYTPSLLLTANGTYTLGVSARNNADLLSTYPSSPDTWTFLLDTVAPSEAMGAVIADLGPSPRTIGTEQFTADTKPTVWVEVRDNLGGSGFNNDISPSSIEIKVYSDAAMAVEVSGSTTAGTRPLTNDEEWEATWVPDGSLDDGDYYYQVIAKDDAGNEGTITDPSFKFTVDTTAPTGTGKAEVGSVNAANGKRFTNNPEIAIAWAASTDPATGGAPGSGLIGYKLEIWTKTATDAVPTGTKVYAASGTYDAWLGDSFVAPCGPPFGLTEYYTTGALTLTSGTSYGAWIKAFDFLGNASAWFDPPFIYDSDAPSNPGTPLVVDISSAGKIASHAPKFQWAHSSDAKTGVAQSGVDFYEFQIKRADGTAWDVFATVIDIDDEDVDLDGTDTPLTGDFRWTLPSPYTLDDGEYIARVRSFDVAGNYSAWVESTQFEVDTTPPPIPGIPTTTSPTNSQTPDWTWNPRDDMSAPGEAPVGYNVYLDDTFIKNVTTNAFVTSDYVPTVLLEGRHELQVTALDAVGNESARSATGHVVIDITKPKAPTMAALPPDNRTNTVTFTWTAVSDAALYTLKPNRNSVAQSPIPGTLTSCSVDVTSWDEGDVVGAVVTATDAAGNESDPSNEASTVIDRVKPTVTAVTTPPTPTTNPRPTWEWEAMDTGGSGVSRCVLTLDDYEPFEVVAPGSTFTPEFNLPDDIHVLRVVAVDRAGNESTELVFNGVKVDTKPIDAPAIRPIAEGYNTSPLTLKWNAITDGNNTVTYVLQWAKNAGFSGARELDVGPTEGAQRLFYFSGPNRGEGEYWFRAKTISTVNGTTTPPQTKESGWSAIVSTIYDVTPPVAPILTLETPNPTNQSPQRWSWTAPEGAVGYEVRVNSVSPDTWEDIGDACTRETTFAETGTYTFEVRAYDWLGNKGNDENHIALGRVEVDVTAPSIPTGLSVVTPTTDRTPEWTWADPGQDPPNDDLKGYEVLLDETELIDVGLVRSYTHSETLDEGAHKLQVRSYDRLGNKSEWCGAVAVVIDTGAPKAPAIEPIAKGYNASPLTLRWNAVTDPPNTVTYVLQWAKDAGFSGAHEVTIATGTEYVFSFTDDPVNKGEGEYWFRVKTISTVNGDTDPKQTKESGWSAVVSTSYYVTGPAAPVLTLKSKNPTNEPTQEWTWSRPVDAVDYDLYWSKTDSAPGASITPSAARVGNIDLYRTTFANPGEEKTYYVWVRGIDALGNKGRWSEKVDDVTPSVTVDMKAPVSPENLRLASDHIADMEGRLYTADATPKVKWNGPEDAAHYDVWLDGKYWISTGSTEYEFTEGLPDGVHSVKVASVDALGNSDGYSNTLEFTVDTTPPETPGMPRTESPTANRRPTWEWNAMSGAVTYRVFLDGMAQPAGQPNGTVQRGTTFTPAADLADGRHDLQVTAIDALGNESAKSAAGSVFIDSTAPAVPDMAHLPTHTRATQVVFRWASIGDVVGYNFSYIVGDGEEWTTIEGITTQSYVVKGPDGRDLRDGEVVQGKVQAYDSLENTSEWSGVESTVIDLAGPTVRIIAPDGAKNTNLSTFTWTWTGDDGERGSGVQGYWVKLNDEAWSWTTESVLASSRLHRGANVLRVKGVDNLGNEGAVTVAPTVTLVDVAIFDVMPAPGEHPINEASTIVFSVAGLYDGRVEVLLSNKPIEDAWRLVTIVNTPGLAKFYVLLDDAVMQPGSLTVAIKIGDVVRYCDYEVLDERSGFGFGRLRPW